MPQNPANILDSYKSLVSEQKITRDPAQEAVLYKLYKLQQDIETHILQGNIFFKKIFAKNAQKLNNGMYIYGDVGRGKSMLMDLFFEASQVKKKRRVHFHAFMIEVHKSLFAWRRENNSKGDTDPIPPLAKKIAKDANLLCFDEFQVSDIADAMILGRLFTYLFKLGVIVVATSNRAPDDLYKDGLQRDQFLPFIELLKKQVDICELNADQDYRLSHLKSLATVYYDPLGKESDNFLTNIFAELTNNSKPEKRILEINNRQLTLGKTYGDVLWSSFSDLCEQALGSADYIEIALEFSTVLLSDIPTLTNEERNEAKRFVILIDTLYEHNVKLICTATASPDKLYKQGDGRFEFERTVSRLIEMQSDKYLKTEHLN